MTTQERQLLNARIAELLHQALVTIRGCTFETSGDADEPDRRGEINDLADLLHNMPRYIVGHDEYALDSFDQFRAAVVEHVKRFYPSINPAEHHYVRLLDMDPDEFLKHYRDHQWGEPERASAM